MRLPRRLPMAATALILAVLLPPGASTAATEAPADDPLAIAPADGSSLDDGGWFRLEADPGGTAAQAITIRNDGTTAAVVRVAAVDAGTGNLGGVSYAAPDDVPVATATWIDLDADAIELAPGESALVAFEVTVPDDAEGGTHLAGIAIWQPAAAEETAVVAEGDASASIVVQTRRIIAVQVDLPGGGGPQLAIEDVEVLARPDGLHLGLHLANTGSTLTSATGRVTMPDGTTTPLAVGTLVPGTATVYPVRWTDSIADGTYPVAADLSYAGDTTSFDGEVVVGDGIRAQLADRQIPTGSAALLPSWLLAALVAVVLLGTGAGAVAVRRRRAPRPIRPEVRPPPQPDPVATWGPVPAATPVHDPALPVGARGWTTPAAR